MLAVPGKPSEDDTWIVELKFDGMRALTVCEADGRCRIYSRNQRRIESFPDVAERVTTALDGRSAILDGELVAVDARGHSSFARLQRRIHLARPTQHQIRNTPVEYVVFDLLSLDGQSRTALPYRQRRQLLEDLHLHGHGLSTAPVWPGADGPRVLAAVAEAGLEGVVSKRLDSVYHPGRSRAWVKTAVRKFGDAIILGWLPGSGSHANTLGSLILGGRNNDGNLVFIGCVGTGFSDSARGVLRRALDDLSAPTPEVTGGLPRDILERAQWCTPILVADIAYREISADGLLRHSSFRGIKADIRAIDVGLPD